MDSAGCNSVHCNLFMPLTFIRESYQLVALVKRSLSRLRLDLIAVVISELNPLDWDTEKRGKTEGGGGDGANRSILAAEGRVHSTRFSTSQ